MERFNAYGRRGGARSAASIPRRDSWRASAGSCSTGSSFARRCRPGPRRLVRRMVPPERDLRERRIRWGPCASARGSPFPASDPVVIVDLGAKRRLLHVARDRPACSAAACATSGSSAIRGGRGLLPGVRATACTRNARSRRRSGLVHRGPVGGASRPSGHFDDGDAQYARRVVSPFRRRYKGRPVPYDRRHDVPSATSEPSTCSSATSRGAEAALPGKAIRTSCGRCARGRHGSCILACGDANELPASARPSTVSTGRPCLRAGGRGEHGGWPNAERPAG